MNIKEQIEKYRIVPVIAIENADDALTLADSLIEGGLPIIEITFRTAAAGKVIEILKRERSEMIIGAGTVLTVDNLKRAIDSGASFAVAPGLNRNVVEEALKLGFNFMPGVMTPSDVELALSYGLNILKFFPAEVAGGVNYLKSMSAPYKHTGVKFIPTGGINTGNLKDYLSCNVVLAVGGTWIAKKEDISAHKWNIIKNRCKEALKILEKA
ncbi:MAG: bifunctional 4-hydroxy-2-oxoglutarate aldolase/2-dehydro-3-deoxy-phosphogluconate aldolase [Candidatus Marinimicrobia bacterium]|nr:bifunctional 4-hydroxy-2-oxoglutarate aldolase/2-dehydro-3-deoxy-phosphogluconate aldolase [Candidatus Neomarinimicrobiota bacterium]